VGDFPVAEASADALLSLPIYAELTDDQIGYVADTLRAAVGKFGNA
jgi:dTDP-4-amino-4,6-dideoxygalactose transaminase